MHTVVSQQISRYAAEAIWPRLLEYFVEIEPLKLLRCRRTTLRKLGLSERKVEYVKSVAKTVRRQAICKASPRAYRTLAAFSIRWQPVHVALLRCRRKS